MMVYLGSVDFVDDEGNLVRIHDYFDESVGMPYYRTEMLRRGYRRVQPEEEISREVVRSWTGADIEVRKYRDRFGRIQTDEKVVRLNTGDDYDCPPDGRFGGW